MPGFLEDLFRKFQNAKMLIGMKYGEGIPGAPAEERYSRTPTFIVPGEHLIPDSDYMGMTTDRAPSGIARRQSLTAGPEQAEILKSLAELWKSRPSQTIFAAGKHKRFRDIMRHEGTHALMTQAGLSDRQKEDLLLRIQPEGTYWQGFPQHELTERVAYASDSKPPSPGQQRVRNSVLNALEEFGKTETTKRYNALIRGAK